MSNQNDFVAQYLFEDLLAVGASAKLVSRIATQSRVLNTKNRTHGVKARRGDGTFGELIPGESATVDSHFAVPRGAIATVEIGAECKVLAKAMIKQIDRVMNDMRNQAAEFRTGVGSNPITVGIVGVNHAKYAVGYEGDAVHRTGVIVKVDPVTGKSKRVNHKHPIQEAGDAILRIANGVQPFFDETVLLRYVATNDQPFDFAWVDKSLQQRDYAASLVRICREYESRF